MDSSFEESESHDGVDSNQGERPTLDAEQEASSAPTSSFELTDRQVVKQMIENHPCFPVRYTHEGIWLRWDGMRWQQTNADDVKRVLLRCNEEYMEGLDEGDVERLELCHKLDDTGSRLLALAKTVDDLVLDDRLLDKRPELLNCVNGTVDLRTGELYPHDRGHHLTQVAPMEYQPDAECPEFAAFLERTFDGDHELIDHVLTVLGYSLTGDTGEQIFWVWYGPTGQNGKSDRKSVV